MKLMYQPCDFCTPLDRITAASLWRLKAHTLLKMDLVPDYNRDGKIDIKDRNKITDTKPHRFWFNDDDDIDEVSGIDVSGGGSADWTSVSVDTCRDLVDFFPVFIDLKSFLDGIDDLSAITVKLKHADGGLNLVYTDLLPEDAGDYVRKSNLTTGFGSNFDKAPGEANTVVVNSVGHTLSEAFLTKIRDEDKGVLLFEGAKNSSSILSEPLVLEVSNSAGKLFDFEMPLRLGPVEQMFRHENLCGTIGTAVNESSRTGEPTLYPDALTSDNTFAFVHGYNVPQFYARGWNSEMFKRLHQIGSKAKFVGVTWDGDTGVDYHEAVYRAFRTSEHIGSALNKYTGLTVAAHSLGNMVVSNAIENHGFDPDRYFMLNAATPIEAYSAGQTSNSSGNVDMNEYMTEHDWKPYDDKLFAANWYQLLPTGADGKELTWKDRFSNVSDRAYNFYSPGEDVVENARSDESITAAAWQVILTAATEFTLEDSFAFSMLGLSMK